MSEDLSMQPAGRQAEALAAGKVTARGLLESCLARIEAANPAIGAFWHVDAAGARAGADDADRRRRAGRALSVLDGLTVGIKDNIDVAGLPCTAGIAAFRGRIADRDAPVVTRLREAGMVPVGKTAMDEGAFGASGAAEGFARCDNPLRPGFTTGGSSAGSAAAIAARFCALALGSDTMGSVRIPAAYCGIAGLKPTAGLLSRSGVVPLSTTLDCVGVLGLTPRDTVLALALLAGFDGADMQSVEPPPCRTPDQDGRRASGWVLGVPRQLARIPLEPAVAQGFAAARQAAEAMGAVVTEIDIAGWLPTETRRAALLLCEAEAAVIHAALIDDSGAASTSYRAALAFGRDVRAGKLVMAKARLDEARAGAVRALSRVDALLMPTEPQRAFLPGTPAVQGDLTTLANVAGLPALSLPWPAEDGGLPCSIQLVGRPFEEGRLAALAQALAGSPNG